MRLVYLILGWGLVILGAMHMLAATHFFSTLTGAALWFFSGGISISLTGVPVNSTLGAQTILVESIFIGGHL